MYGDQSMRLTGKLQRLPTQEERERFLVEWFHPYFSRLPGYDATDPRCDVADCLATNWLHDELAGNGSYTNFRVGVTAGDAHVEDLRGGVPEGGLWLAGEHTAPFLGLGTVTGAYWSGQNVARRIAEKYGQEVPPEV